MCEAKKTNEYRQIDMETNSISIFFHSSFLCCCNDRDVSSLVSHVAIESHIALN